MSTKVYEKYKERRAALEMEFAKEYGAIYERRAEVVAGRARDMDDGERCRGGHHDTGMAAEKKNVHMKHRNKT